MRRADDVDPDVRESAFAATEPGDQTTRTTGTACARAPTSTPTTRRARRTPTATRLADHDGVADDTDATPTRAERREAREQGTLVDVDRDTDVDADRDGVADRDEATDRDGVADRDEAADRDDVPDGHGVAGVAAVSDRDTVVDRDATPTPTTRHPATSANARGCRERLRWASEWPRVPPPVPRPGGAVTTSATRRASGSPPRPTSVTTCRRTLRRRTFTRHPYRVATVA